MAAAEPQQGTDHDLPASLLAAFIREDFRAAWDAVAGLPEEVGARGNFMFARQAMNLLELASRTCSADQTGATLTDFSSALEQKEPRYFSMLPGITARPGKSRKGVDFTLPHGKAAPHEAQLLWALFDLIRNGQAHLYQQIMVELNDGQIFGASLTGAAKGRTLEASAATRPANHLSLMPGDDGSLWVVVYPDVLFLDFEAAIEQARVFGRGLEHLPFTRKARQHGNWDFSAFDAREALENAGHPDWKPPQSSEAKTAAGLRLGAGGRIARLRNWIADRIAA